MQYAILVYETEANIAARTDPVESPAYMGAYAAYSQALEQAGVSVGGAALLPPSTATSVSVRNGKRLVQDGPYPDTKEQLGGIFLIDVPDLDTALDWAARCPAASLASVEVRPVLTPPSED
jgi:hypothetical protein